MLEQKQVRRSSFRLFYLLRLADLGCKNKEFQIMQLLWVAIREKEREREC